MRTRTSIALVSLLACVLLTRHAFGPPVSPGKVALIKPGMSEADVRKILGLPEEVLRAGDINMLDGTNIVSGARWFYTRSFTFGSIIVLFDTNGSVRYTHRDTFLTEQ